MLTAADFPVFYQEVHHQDPFPWQRGLAEQVLACGDWPDLVDVPTGLGKTSMLDVVVFLAAATAGQPRAARIGRRRVLFVVDRRIVVDEATSHAETISSALQAAADGDAEGVVGTVARALRSYAPDAGGQVLAVTRMRGGVTWDAAWLDRPDRPGIVISTVDQVGSRLLFRGYGVSDRRKPIDAGLVGTDSLLLVDEAHLAEALITTVEAATVRDRLQLPLPGLRAVQLTATPGADTGAMAARPTQGRCSWSGFGASRAYLASAVASRTGWMRPRPRRPRSSSTARTGSTRRCRNGSTRSGTVRLLPTSRKPLTRTVDAASL